MRVLITGSAGLLGRALIESTPSDVELTLIYRNTKPLTHHKLIQHDLKHRLDLSNIKPDVVIHCAAEGNVDKIQQHAYLGVECILDPTINIIKEVEKADAKLIYVSTNAVFNGENAPYDDHATPCPINSYGIFKAACELAVQGSNIQRWNIVRPLLMYGWPNDGQRSNWVPIWIDKLKRGEICNVVYDIISQPLYNKDCADVIWKVIKHDINKNIFNISGADSCSLYNFARTVAEEIGVDKHLVEPVPSSFFKSLAPRPKDTSYSNKNIKDILSHNPVGIREGIRAMLKEKQC